MGSRTQAAVCFLPHRADSKDWRAFIETVSDLRAGRTGWPAEFPVVNPSVSGTKASARRLSAKLGRHLAPRAA